MSFRLRLKPTTFFTQGVSVAWLCLRVYTTSALAYLASRPKSSQRRRTDLLARRYSSKVGGLSDSRCGCTISVSCSLALSPIASWYSQAGGCCALNRMGFDSILLTSAGRRIRISSWPHPMGWFLERLPCGIVARKNVLKIGRRCGIRLIMDCFNLSHQ